MDFEALLRTAGTEIAAIELRPLVTRMVAAAVIGVALATRPWRLLMRRPLPRTEMIHAQILLCAAAAVITAVIGDSLAKAFGLVGLGSFVRFRSGLKDPRDAAILFLVIGLGMACGHGSLALAAVGTVFVALLLIAIDLMGGASPAPEPQRVKFSAASDDVAADELALREAFGRRNVLVKACTIDLTNRRLELDLEERQPGAIAAAVQAANRASLRELRWGTSVSPKGQREELV